MKSLLVLLAFVFCSTSVFAEPDLAAAKAEMTAHLDQRIAHLNEAKTCIANATQREDMKKCHKALKEEHMEMKNDRHSKREARLKEKMQKAESKQEAN